ncbi:MAG: hypothetical protein HOF98_04455 [Gammaproteobacteria bacterium]|jgi:hypothetical protein|nr:hypothetical protein [Gammaproteobacteria bacterium]MBT5221573.1 hypothetical protein [Gammaproteobacteria bacterium]MBT5824781.1 hypothetical protein [Gammaproteobacteria bacterium]MBT6419852.1 hypothetical protein [Gammaproteobacteria bacterium]MBT7434736.1 hypothetical protein [Gammaproteobacteria bacterium]
MDKDDTAKKKSLQAKLTRLENKVTKLSSQLKANEVTIKEYKASLQISNKQILELEQALQSSPEPTINGSPSSVINTSDLTALFKSFFEQEVTDRAKHYINKSQETKEQYIKLSLDTIDQKLIAPGYKLYEKSLALAIDLPIHLTKKMQHKVIGPSIQKIKSSRVYAEDFYQDNLKQIVVIIIRLYQMISLWISEIKAIIKGDKPLDIAFFKKSLQIA